MTKILLIEDDAKFRKMLKLLLTHSGYDVVEAENGKKGIQAFQQAPCDLIITDVFMPEQDGLGVLRALIKSHPDLKAIAISGGGKRGVYRYLEYASLFGAKKTLIKPFESEEFLTAVEETLAM